MTIDLAAIVSGLSILGTLLVAGRLVFRTESKADQLAVEVIRIARHLEDAEKAITTFKVDHGATSAATSKDVEALKRDLDRLNETVGQGMKDLADKVHALTFALRARPSGNPRESS